MRTPLQCLLKCKAHSSDFIQSLFRLECLGFPNVHTKGTNNILQVFKLVDCHTLAYVVLGTEFRFFFYLKQFLHPFRFW